MNINNALSDLFRNKIEKQARLKEKNNELKELELDIDKSKFLRWFGTSYLVTKRLISLFLGIIFILLALVIVIYPEYFFQNQQLKKELINESRTYYSEMFGSTLQETLSRIAENNSELTVEKVINQLDQSINIVIEKEIISSIQWLALPFFFIAFVLFYISRMTHKIRMRNHKISKIEKMTQTIITSYKRTIDEEEKELIILQNIIDATNKKSN